MQNKKILDKIKFWVNDLKPNPELFLTKMFGLPDLNVR